MYKNFVVITAKGNNMSIKDKNLIEANSNPLIYYSIAAAKNSSLIDEIYVSTECSKIKAYCINNNVKIIDRPIDLSQPDSNHGDVIIHAYDFLKSVYGSFDSLTILLGNTIMTTSEDIDNAINKLFESENYSSSMTVWKAQDDHPFRAMKINNTGYLESFIYTDSSISTNRQSYPDVYFYDQGPWVVKSETLESSKKNRIGPGPWWWMGQNCVPIIREWVTGRDVHSQIDIDIAEWWLNYSHKNTAK